MAGLISVALAIWGVILPWVITFNVANEQPPGYEGLWIVAYAAPVTYPSDLHPSSCNITYIAPHIQDLTIHELQNVTTHEVGHCLGLNHISQPGIMAPSYGADFSGYDRLEYWRHYPAPYQLHVPY